MGKASTCQLLPLSVHAKSKAQPVYVLRASHKLMHILKYLYMSRILMHAAKWTQFVLGHQVVLGSRRTNVQMGRRSLSELACLLQYEDESLSSN